MRLGAELRQVELAMQVHKRVHGVDKPRLIQGLQHLHPVEEAFPPAKPKDPYQVKRSERNHAARGIARSHAVGS